MLTIAITRSPREELPKGKDLGFYGTVKPGFQVAEGEAQGFTIVRHGTVSALLRFGDLSCSSCGLLT